MKLSIVGLLAVVAAGPAATATFAQSAPAATTAPAASDKAISERIAKRLAEEPGLKADAVRVKVENGVVTLSGVVANDADRDRAERLAHVDGVTKVDNDLHTREGAKSGVKGTAGTVADKTKEGAEKVGGKTKDGAEKVGEKTKEGAGKVGEKGKEGLSKTGEVITDGWITSRISAKFVNEDLLKDSNINVDTDNHVVTLHGTVLTAAGRRRAVEVAKEVEGVHRVVDRMTIGPKK
jgi:osmotically-inducible protein OsmY